CTSVPIWSAEVNEKVTIYNIIAGVETNFKQISFDNKGKIIPAGCLAGVVCSVDNTFIIKLSDTNATSGEKVIY
ncbi:MAG: hypothetical protein HRU38_25550, partial [Saccharospirillaceae bacterium]|nr:hypothetical protein [Saccharospirillaceae bacterium]